MGIMKRFMNGSRVVWVLCACLALATPALAVPGPEETPGKKAAKKAAPQPEKPPAVAPKKDAGVENDGEKEREPGGSERKLSVDEAYVRAKLESRLSPTSIQFFDDGTVRLTFDFESKTEGQEEAFQPKISKNQNAVFRWTNREDEYWVNSSSTYAPRDADFMKGLKVSNAGAAHLDVWFTEEVDAEICYVSAVNSSKKQLAAVVFTNGSQKSIGSDHGTQCLTLLKGKPQKVAKGAAEPLSVHTLARFKLVVKNGSYEAWRDGKKKATSEYKKEDFGSGRIGIVWSGIGSFISRLEVTGKLDYKKVAADLRKAKQ
jgi:hypothetical protein